MTKIGEGQFGKLARKGVVLRFRAVFGLNCAEIVHATCDGGVG